MTNDKALIKIANDTTDLMCHIQMMKAVAYSFSNEYVDVPDSQILLAMQNDPEDYRSLFNAFYTLMDIVSTKAKELEAFAAETAKPQ